MKRVFLDADVLFTAVHNPGGKAEFIIELGTARHFLLFTSDAAREEAMRNLALKFPYSLSFYNTLISPIIIVTADRLTPAPAGLSARDTAIFQAASACRATHLLTCDKRHFEAVIDLPDVTNRFLIQTTTEFLTVL